MCGAPRAPHIVRIGYWANGGCTRGIRPYFLKNRLMPLRPRKRQIVQQGPEKA
jgi:hypothetical protein